GGGQPSIHYAHCATRLLAGVLLARPGGARRCAASRPVLPRAHGWLAGSGRGAAGESARRVGSLRRPSADPTYCSVREISLIRQFRANLSIQTPAPWDAGGQSRTELCAESLEQSPSVTSSPSSWRDFA